MAAWERPFLPPARVVENPINEVVNSREHVFHRIPEAETVDFSAEGQWLAVAGQHGVRLFAARDCSIRNSLPLDPCGPVSFNPRGGELLTFGLFCHAWRWPITPVGSGSPDWKIGPARRVIPLNPLDLVNRFTLRPQHTGRHIGWTGDGKQMVLADSRNSEVLLIDSKDSGSVRRIGPRLADCRGHCAGCGHDAAVEFRLAVGGI